MRADLQVRNYRLQHRRRARKPIICLERDPESGAQSGPEEDTKNQKKVVTVSQLMGGHRDQWR